MRKMNWQIEKGTLEELISIEEQIPEFTASKSKETVLSRIQGATFLLLVAKLDGKPIAYKLGYELSNEQFYSWLGAVVPAYRGSGIAQSLLDAQEQWCASRGYSCISVKSMNKFKSMLMILIKNNYQIVECRPLSDGSDSKIRFLKRLN
ncbi:GNAT family N-acetyltransferase [Pseudoalteromonas luteoviolacea]|uniref:GNAT family N-acetyltransferase n=1 Tax=Pseudoalteromonas luteoviolacea TaxID=43657 RepID=UPI001E48CD1B|nr:GNAT family N-acetyltransferase [Pseudoalteromonas luteoviolacea]